MKKIRNVLGNGTVEVRIYDEDGKLVEIRKEEPPRTITRGLIRRCPGASGGHEF